MPPQVLQATPSGFLVQLDDGSQHEFPEDIVLKSGLLQPGGYGPREQSPVGTLGAPVAPPQAPPVQPSLPNVQQPMGGPSSTFGAAAPPPQPVLPPGVGSMGHSNSVSTRQPVWMDRGAPPPTTGFDQSLADQRAADAATQQTIAQQGTALRQKQAAQSDVDIYDAKGEAIKAQRTADDAAHMQAIHDAGEEAKAAFRAKLDAQVAAVPKEDPRHYFSSQGAFDNVASAIGMFAGSMLGVYSGSGKNQFAEGIDRLVQRDIEAQRTNIENEWKKVGYSKEQMADMRVSLLENEQFVAGQQAKMYTALSANLLAGREQFSSEVKRGEMEQAAAVLAQKGAEAHQAAVMGADKTITNKVQLQHDDWFKRQQLGEMAASRHSQETIAGMHAGSGKPDPAQHAPVLATLPDGTDVHGNPKYEDVYIHPKFAVDMDAGQISALKDDFAAYRKATGAMTAYRERIQQLGRHYQGIGADNRWSPQDIHAAIVARDDLAYTLTNQVAKSTFTDEVVKAEKNMIGEPIGWTGPNPLQGQNVLLENMFKKAGADLAGRGAVVVKHNPVRDPGTAGPRPDGKGPVRPASTEDVQTFEPFDALATWNVAAPTDGTADPDPKQLVSQVQKLGSAVITSNDPDTVLSAAQGLVDTADAPLQSGRAMVQQMFQGARIGSAPDGKGGTKLSVAYAQPGDLESGIDPVRGGARTPEEGLQLIKTKIARMANMTDDPEKKAALVKVGKELQRVHSGIGKEKPFVPAGGRFPVAPVNSDLGGSD